VAHVHLDRNRKRNACADLLDDAGGDAKIIERFGAAADPPVALEFPEGEYLKGLLVLKG